MEKGADPTLKIRIVNSLSHGRLVHDTSKINILVQYNNPVRFCYKNQQHENQGPTDHGFEGYFA